jgi:arylsulfatase A-like enzyme
MTMDLYVTLIEATGAINEDDTLDSRSFLPTLLGRKQLPLREEWYWTRREGGGFGGKTIEALRKGDWKLVWNDPFGKAELYNLADDPQEQHNLIAERPKIANDLRTALMKHIQRGGEVPWQKPAE